MTGGVTGGIVGGLDAVIDGRTFWDGSKVTTRKSQFYGVRKLYGGQNNCVDDSYAAMDQAMGGNLQQYDIRNAIAPGSDPNTVPLNIREANEAYKTLTGRNSELVGGHYSKPDIISHMDTNGGVLVHMNNQGTNVGHTVATRQVIQKVIIKPNGTMQVKYIFRVMDPAQGYIRLSGSRLKDIVGYSLMFR